MAYTEAKPKIWNMTGTFKKFKVGIYDYHNPKTGEIQKRIKLYGDNVQQRIQNFFQKYGDYILIKMSVMFAETAAKYTPPNIGNAYIDPKYYYRPVQDLALLAKGGYPPYHATKADYAALREGYKFRVLNTKKGHKKNDVYAYCRGINEAKRASRIQNRGLSRYSWGANLNNTKEDIRNQQAKGEMPWDWNIYRIKKMPPIFNRLASQSPSIKKWTWGTYDWHNDKKNQNKIVWKVTNRLAQIQRYGEIAVRQGLRVAKRIAESVFRGVEIIAKTPGQARTGNAYDKDLVAISSLRKQLIHMFDSVTKEYDIDALEWEGGPNKNSRGQAKIASNNAVNVTIKY